MKVTATAKGFHGTYREAGEEFDVPDGSKASWYKATKQLEADTKADAAKALVAKAEKAKADAANATKDADDALKAAQAAQVVTTAFQPTAPKEGGDLV